MGHTITELRIANGNYDMPETAAVEAYADTTLVRVFDEEGEGIGWGYATGPFDAEASIRSMLADAGIVDPMDEIILTGTRRVEMSSDLDEARRTQSSTTRIVEFDEDGYDYEGRDWMGLDRDGLFEDGWDPIAEEYLKPKLDVCAA